ncbi:MAG: inositol monophosphatase, partial [Myxococcales bacterium]|nr:inositol monophosphatase [Myxococcales bacterium]
MDEPRDLVDVAVTIAREAGKLLMQDLAVGRFGGEVEAKSSRELVSRVDRASESLIRQLVAEVAPDHEVLGEEQGLEGDSDASHRWIVDPLDGTTNYLHGHPFFAVSIGVEARDAGLVAAVVHAPCLGETFFAAKGDGAYLNTRAIRLIVSGAERLDDALLATGFAYDRAKYPNEQRFLRMLAAARGIRRCGSAALDLA